MPPFSVLGFHSGTLDDPNPELLENLWLPDGILSSSKGTSPGRLQVDSDQLFFGSAQSHSALDDRIAGVRRSRPADVDAVAGAFLRHEFQYLLCFALRAPLVQSVE